MMRWLFAVLLVGCSNGGPLWQECETASDCPAGYGCTRTREAAGWCVRACETNEECDFGPQRESEAECGAFALCDADDAACACDIEPETPGFPHGCGDDSDCMFPYTTCMADNRCYACATRGCLLTRCNDDSDCAGARCVAGTCRP